jgi:hypothetical protein
VAVGRGLAEDRPAEIELLDQHAGARVEGLEDRRGELVVGDHAGAERVDQHRDRLGDADGVGELDLAATGEARGDDVLGDVARVVRGRAIDLARVLAREGAAAVAGVAAVGVDDDLAAGEARVALRTADDEPARRVDVDLGLVGHELGRDDRLDDQLADRLLERSASA